MHACGGLVLWWFNYTQIPLIGSGLGRLMAARFSALGTKVVLVDINEKGNEETLELLRKTGGDGRTYKCDLSKRDDIYSMAKKVMRFANVGIFLILNLFTCHPGVLG